MAKAGNLVSEVFWSKDPSDEEQSMVFVPGLLMEGNIRPESKVKSKTQEVGAELSLQSDSVFVNPLKTKSGKLSMPNKVMKEHKGTKSASLKDLCPEDKRRIANLIKELARVSEEKEETVERLKAEHESFEKKIKELEDQNELIVTEREDILNWSKISCDQFLFLFQNKYNSPKERNEACKRHWSNKEKVCSEKNPPHLASSDQDGSYLGIVPACTLNPSGKAKQVLVGPSFAPQPDLGLYSANHNSVNQVQHTESFPSQDGCGTKSGNIIRGEPVADRHYNMNKRVDVGAVQAGTFCDSDAGQPSHCGWLRNRELADENQLTNIRNGHLKPLIECSCCTGMSHDPAMNNQVGIMADEVLNGKKLLIDQKQQLICQKMELELEKERLQRLLAQQETLFFRKQQQLHESRLDYSRYLRTEDDLSHGNLQHQERNIKASMTEPWEKLNAGNRMIGPFDPELNAFRGTGSLYPAHAQNKETGTPLLKKDVATSPLLLLTKNECVNTATSPFWVESSSNEASLVHLVDALSPISLQKHNLHIKEGNGKLRKNSTMHGRKHQNLAKAGTAPTDSGDSDEELEESRMLEDVFFI
ncbi:protein hinderin [Rhincodon typus]|uniref:protein hinderin n=1 Tax=Rhincodon typus TaxID=259920 RepID=UPI00202EB2BD|nr:protein hinderin [Rhincodon typus]